jgi:hypothetical protein
MIGKNADRSLERIRRLLNFRNQQLTYDYKLIKSLVDFFTSDDGNVFKSA